MHHNIASHLALRAGTSPHQPAVISPRHRLTFAELESYSNQCASALLRAGIRKGMRTVVMLRPGKDFLAVCFALLKLGAVMVLVDPGMGRNNLGKCLQEASPEAFVGVPLAQFARGVLGWASGSLRIKISVGRPGWGGTPLKSLFQPEGGGQNLPAQAVRPEDPAAIAFTSGSTGVPKGVVCTHRMFDAQYQLLRDGYGIQPGEVDLATFPLFALFDPALGMTTVFPKMDFSRPGRVHAPDIIDAIQTHRVTHMFGSPALLTRVVDHYGGSRPRLDSVRRVLTAGAPVSRRVLQGFGEFLAGGEVFTPYGATEALPVSSIASSELLGLKGSGGAKGVCVGRPLPGVHVDIIRISEEPFDRLSEDLLLPAGETGELAVAGPNVSVEYFGRPQANLLSKLRLRDGRTGHRTGDLGYFDDRGRIWFCGRKSHRVITPRGVLFSVPTEGIFNQHPQVRRTALVGVGQSPDQTPVLCVELTAGKRRAKRGIRAELLDIAAQNEGTSHIRNVLFHKSFPVDVRHNSKICREKLARWAAPRI